MPPPSQENSLAGSKAPSTARPVAPRPKARVGTPRPLRGCPRRPPARTRKGSRHPLARPPTLCCHLQPASASPLPSARRGRRPRSAQRCFSFPSGTATATSHPGARWRRRCWGPGAWGELLRGGGDRGGGGAKGWAVVTAAEGRQLERVGGSRAKAARSSPRTRAGGGEGSDGREEGSPSGGGTE